MEGKDELGDLKLETLMFLGMPEQRLPGGRGVPGEGLEGREGGEV